MNDGCAGFQEFGTSSFPRSAHSAPLRRLQLLIEWGASDFEIRRRPYAVDRAETA
jgi:hypothetical protein